MALQLPDWYREDVNEDAEAVICDLFEWLLEGCDIPVVTWMTDEMYENPRPTLRVHRAGGRANASLPIDEPVIQIGAWSQSRRDSWRLIEFTRAVMEAVSGGFKVPRSTLGPSGERVYTQINDVEEFSGPIQLMDEFADDRFIPVNYRVLIRKNRRYNADHYRRILNNLPS